MTVLLDTSALLLHYFDAPGGRRIMDLITDGANEILVASISLAELARRLVATGVDPAAARSTALSYASLAGRVIPVDAAAAIRAFELATTAGRRIPLANVLIAACASISDATLVHRDDHFHAIPAALLRQADAAA